MKKLLFLLVGFLCIITACSGGADEASDTPSLEPAPESDYIHIDSSIMTNGLVFDASGGEKTISFSTNKEWMLSVSNTVGGSTWCGTSGISTGAGASTVTFIAAENTGYDDRSVSVTIKAGTASVTFPITQKCADALLVTSSRFDIPQEGGVIDVEVKANVSYQLEISENAKSWITENESRALSTQKHTFTITGHEDYDKREGEIYIKSGEKLETVKVYQSGGAILLLSKDEYMVSDQGETILVDVKSNMDFSVQMPDVNWLHVEDASRAMSSHTLRYVVDANEAYDSRSAQIVFYDKQSDLKDTLTVVQLQKDAIILSSKEVTVGSSSCTVEANVNTNIEFEIKIPNAEWITEMPTSRGLTEHTKSFAIAENQTNQNRTGQVVFFNTSKEIADTLTITQVQNDMLIIFQKYYEVNESETTIDVKYQTNLELEYIIPYEFSGWIRMATTSRSLSEYCQSFIISANNGYDARNGYILFKDKNSNLQETVNVVQEQKDAIILSRKEYEIAAQGGNIVVSYESNVPVTISSNSDWIKINSVSSRALNSSSFAVEVSENKSYKIRIGTVTISNTDGTLSKTLTITQGAKSTDGSMENIDEEQEKEW